MISNKTSLSGTNNAPLYAQINHFGTRKDLYEQVKSRFLQQSAKYLGCTLTNREIEALLNQKYYVHS